MSKVTLHNQWNKAAIELSQENLKIPSSRNEVKSLPKTCKRSSQTEKRTTNEWNTMALKKNYT